MIPLSPESYRLHAICFLGYWNLGKSSKHIFCKWRTPGRRIIWQRQKTRRNLRCRVRAVSARRTQPAPGFRPGRLLRSTCRSRSCGDRNATFQRRRQTRVLNRLKMYSGPESSLLAWYHTEALPGGTRSETFKGVPICVLCLTCFLHSMFYVGSPFTWLQTPQPPSFPQLQSDTTHSVLDVEKSIRHTLDNQLSAPFTKCLLSSWADKAYFI